MITRENLLNDKGEKASFIQILISFFIQSEVVPLSALTLLFSMSLKNVYNFSLEVTWLKSKDMQSELTVSTAPRACSLSGG